MYTASQKQTAGGKQLLCMTQEVQASRSVMTWGEWGGGGKGGLRGRRYTYNHG